MTGVDHDRDILPNGRSKYMRYKEIIIMKRVCIAALIGVMLLSLTACGKFTCGLCNEEKTGKRYESEFFDFEVCQDCYDEIQGN